MTLRYGLGDSVSISTYTGSLGEIGVNTSTNTIHIFDGLTEGGTALAKLSEVGGGGGSSPSYWVSSASGIYTTRNVAIGTNIVSSGSTILLVKGDARITGILSIGTGTITLDPNSNIITVGAGITLDAAQGSITVSGSKLADATGNANYSGIVTASTFSGPLEGNASTATYATSAGIATALQTARNISLTGDVIGSISFDGTTNVSIAATIQPNSVGLGTDTTGDYVQSLSGTSNQITVTGGTGEGSTPTLSIPNQLTAPQDITVIRDLQVNRNLNVDGNITIGGTSATLFTTELKVYDPDLVLGFRTDTNNNDISTDNTANHGGIAIASTEGSPLVNLFITGIETAPSTYKKIMWFKAGTFSGLGTDAWLSNYAIGIGSTQFPSGTRLAAGSVQFTENDLAVVRNINASGVVTATSFVKSGGTSSQFLKADGSVDSSTYLTSYTETDTLNSVTGRGNSTSNGISVGILTATSGNFSGIITSPGANVSGVVTATSFSGSGTNLTDIVTSIVAGTNITVSGSTGQVTINSTASGGSATASIDLLEVMLFA